MGSFKIGGVVMKHLFKKPSTKMYPVIAREWQERTRGSIGIREEECILCGMCSRKCPTDAITVDRQDATWTIERMQCIQCGHCVEVCPKKCLDMLQAYTTPNTEKVVDVVNVPVKPKAAPKASAEAPAAGGTTLCNDLEQCIYCTLCAKNCPADAITVDRANKVWEVDNDKCIQCGLCVEKCPKKCLELKEAEAAPAADAAAGGDGLTNDLEQCVYCTLCAKNCPADALTVDRAEKVWEVDKDKCIQCGVCVDKCPKKCLSL